MESPIGKLVLLRRDGSVDAFCNRFMTLSYRDPSIIETHQVQLFMAGLGHSLRTDVTLQKSSTLDEAIMLVRVYEQRATAAPSSRLTSHAVSKPPWSAGTATPTVNAPAPASSSTFVNQPTVKKFTSTEIADRRIKGLCFKCDEKFVPGHCDSYKRLLDDEDDDAEPTISLATLTGIQPSTGHTMHVSVTISSTSLRAARLWLHPQLHRHQCHGACERHILRLRRTAGSGGQWGSHLPSGPLLVHAH
jgi:hypothetical protein